MTAADGGHGPSTDRALASHGDVATIVTRDPGELDEEFNGDSWSQSACVVADPATW